MIKDSVSINEEDNNNHNKTAEAHTTTRQWLKKGKQNKHYPFGVHCFGMCVRDRQSINERSHECELHARTPSFNLRKIPLQIAVIAILRIHFNLIHSFLSAE